MMPLARKRPTARVIRTGKSYPGVDYFFGVPPLLVKRLTIDTVERALSTIVNENDGKWLSVYGALQ